MNHSVIREDNGNYLDGRYRDAVIDAVIRDVETVEVENIVFEIVSHDVDPDGNKVTKVAVYGV